MTPPGATPPCGLYDEPYVVRELTAGGQLTGEPLCVCTLAEVESNLRMCGMLGRPIALRPLKHEEQDDDDF